MPHAISPIEQRPLDFHDLTKLSERERQCAVNALSPIMVNAFSRLNPNWSLAVSKPDTQLRQALTEWRVRVLDPIMGKNAISDFYYGFLLDIGESCFTTVDLEERIQACKINGVVAILDDQIPKNPEMRHEAERFVRNLLSGRTPKCMVLREFGESIRRHADMKVDSATGDYLWWSWLNFIVGTNFESRTEAILDTLQIPLKEAGTSSKQPDFSASDLPYFIRIKSGFSEAWALTVFSQNKDHPIPTDMWLTIQSDVVHFLNCINDLMSAPKEIFKGDHATYLNYQTQAKRQIGTRGSGSDGLWCFEDTVVDECDRLVQIVGRLDSTVTERYKHEYAIDSASEATRDAKWVLDTWMVFKAGVFELHFDTKRYSCHKWLPELQKLRLELRELAVTTTPI